jgi:hypothetical protein
VEIRLPMDGGLYLEDLRVGQRFESATLVVTADASILGCLYLARLPGRVDSRQRIDHGPCRYSSVQRIDAELRHGCDRQCRPRRGKS